jgi:hypothetical protein
MARYRIVAVVSGFKNKNDVIQCPYCEHFTYSHNAPIIYQTNFKGTHSSFIEEIQREAKVCISKTKHVVLMGYQLPSDDIAWRNAIMARKDSSAKDKERQYYCSVVVGHKGEDCWLEGKELQCWIDQKKGKVPHEKLVDYGIPAIIAALSIFGDENVRAYTGGIPQVWCSGGIANKSKIEDLLYPKAMFPEGLQSIAVWRNRY